MSQDNRNADNKDYIKITFLYENGEELEVQGKIGDSLLEIARENDVDIEGACGGVCACATCHVWVNDPWLDQLPAAREAEEDMLDQAQQLEMNSRLCCQIIAKSELDGITVTVPNSSKNISGHHH